VQHVSNSGVNVSWLSIAEERERERPGIPQVLWEERKRIRGSILQFTQDTEDTG
jgi:hypothetical protein